MTQFCPANHPHLRYIGRFDTRDPTAMRFAWSTSQIQWCFTGTSCVAHLEETPNLESLSNYFAVRLDDRSPTAFKLDPSQTRYILAQDLELGEHTLTLIKRTEAFFPVVTFRGLELDPEQQLLPIQNIPPYRLEFIGDSITCGYGNEAVNGEEEFSDATENADQSYAAIAARHLNADVVTLCRSGFGLTRNYDQSTQPTMTHRWEQVLWTDPLRWRFQTQIPDAVIINLGTNDFAHEPPQADVFVSAYVQLVQKVRAHYPDVQIVSLIGPIMGDDWPTNPETNQPFPSLTLMREYLAQVQAGVVAEGGQPIQVLELTSQTPERGYGANFHPSLAQHQLNGQELADFLRPLLRQRNFSAD